MADKNLNDDQLIGWLVGKVEVMSEDITAIKKIVGGLQSNVILTKGVIIGISLASGAAGALLSDLIKNIN